MKFISVKAELDNGVIKVPLDKSCRCLVALAEFFLPSIDNVKIILTSPVNKLILVSRIQRDY